MNHIAIPFNDADSIRITLKSGAKVTLERKMQNGVCVEARVLGLPEHLNEEMFEWMAAHGFPYSRPVAAHEVQKWLTD